MKALAIVFIAVAASIIGAQGGACDTDADCPYPDACSGCSCPEGQYCAGACEATYYNCCDENGECGGSFCGGGYDCSCSNCQPVTPPSQACVGDDGALHNDGEICGDYNCGGTVAGYCENDDCEGDSDYWCHCIKLCRSGSCTYVYARQETIPCEGRGCLGNSCAPEGASCNPATCSGDRWCYNSQCAACTASYANCNGNSGDGCEANLNSDAANCGACGTRCGTGEQCNNGRCVSCTTPSLPPALTSPDEGASFAAGTSQVPLSWNHAPDATLYDVRVDYDGSTERDARNNCPGNPHYVCIDGYSGTSITVTVRGGTTYRWWVHARNSCGATLDASSRSFAVSSPAACDTAVCTGSRWCFNNQCIDCTSPYANCDGNSANGCEANVQNDNNNCGACGAACSGSERCSSGRCTPTTDSCAAYSSTCTACTSQSSCGYCGDDNSCRTGGISGPGTGSCAEWKFVSSQCAAPVCDENACNGKYWCYNSQCAACTASFANCNGDSGDGCEINTNTDSNNCGSCGNACSTGEQCIGGTCRCTPGSASCENNRHFACSNEGRWEAEDCPAEGKVCNAISKECALPYTGCEAQECDGDRSVRYAPDCSVAGEERCAVGCNLETGRCNPGHPIIPEPYYSVFVMAQEREGTELELIAAIFKCGEHGGNACPTPYCNTQNAAEEFARSWPNPNGPWASSSAGAAGPFQFIPSSWITYGRDCSGDNRKDVQNLQDAACGAAAHLTCGRTVYDKAYCYNHDGTYATKVANCYNYLKRTDARAEFQQYQTDSAVIAMQIDSLMSDLPEAEKPQWNGARDAFVAIRTIVNSHLSYLETSPDEETEVLARTQEARAAIRNTAEQARTG
ncbi:MAG: lytic murein transglycosylase [Candidatus Aenigmarchaeota archaeon]|nr:lytic murein transglycosylase [Candidatus Aenigmarchaeota archaeon]